MYARLAAYVEAVPMVFDCAVCGDNDTICSAIGTCPGGSCHTVSVHGILIAIG